MKDITTEEAIKILEELSTFDYVKLENGDVAIEKVLNELEKYKELYISTLGQSLNNSIKQNNKHNNDLEALNEGWKIELDKKDKIIDAMAEMLVRVPENGDDLQTLAIQHSLNEHLEEKKNVVKQYYERKVEDD